MKQQYLVTDAIGQLGNAITRLLLDHGHAVRVLVAPESDMTPLKGLPVDTVFGDILVKDSMKQFFDIENIRESIVIHTAEKRSVAESRDPLIHRINVQGTMNVADICVKKRVARLVYIGSAHAIPEKGNGEEIDEIEHFNRDLVQGDYAKSKAEATQYIMNKVTLNGLNAVIVHPSGIIGPFEYGESEIVQLIREYLTGELTTVINGGYDFADVRDVAQGVLSAAEKGNSGSCYILSNQYVSAKDFLEGLQGITGYPPVKKIVPLWVAQKTAKINRVWYRFLKKKAPIDTYAVFTVYPNAKYSHSRADSDLSYKPRDINKSLADTLAWMKRQDKMREREMQGSTTPPASV
ncbi:MAG: NAD-dependent epimerase/dehydratase family protein [Oscillospiraceae bacterium]|nr:NAD-dependent epimerase/dehydratase family protein [Oscillospiraceae bacterium]